MKKIITFGVYDFFHLGHLRLFKQCRQYGDYLIVAIQDENSIKKYKPDSKVLYSSNERKEILSSLREIDKVLVYEDVGVDFLKDVDFDILALGEDHIGERFSNIIDYCKKNNKDIVRLKRTPNICSSGIKEKLSKNEIKE